MKENKEEKKKKQYREIEREREGNRGSETKS